MGPVPCVVCSLTHILPMGLSYARICLAQTDRHCLGLRLHSPLSAPHGPSEAGCRSGRPSLSPKGDFRSVLGSGETAQEGEFESKGAICILAKEKLHLTSDEEMRKSRGSPGASDGRPCVWGVFLEKDVRMMRRGRRGAPGRCGRRGGHCPRGPWAACA